MTAPPKLVVLMTTHNRPSLLANRSLASVAAQTRRPDWVVIADDSRPADYRQNCKTIANFESQTGISILHFGLRRNFRAPNPNHCNIKYADGLGHTRNRNSAVLEILARGFDPQQTWVASLDDDDAWLPIHLAQAENTIAQTDADFLPAAYYWCAGNSRKARFFSKFDGRDFLVGNPGVNGSTLIIRLSVLLRAGMFEESLTASEDRDLCVRMALLKNLKVRQPPQPSVEYYADNRDRVSTPRNPQRLDGIAQFADKYRGWMNGDEYRAFCQRARKLFGWRNEGVRLREPRAHDIKHDIKKVNANAAKKSAHAPERIALICGIIVNPAQFNDALLADLHRLASDSRLAALDVVVLFETAPANLLRAMHKTIAHWRNAGLRIYCIDNAQAKKFFRALKLPVDKNPSIAANRTCLQLAIAAVGAYYQTPIGWALDGDMRLHGLRLRGGRAQPFRPDYIGDILRMRARGDDVALGEMCGAPPLPRALNVRTQLVDVFHHLARLHNSKSPTAHSPRLTLANPRAPIDADYYHDCGAHSHLEQPIGFSPFAASHSVGDSVSDSLGACVKKLPAVLNRILAGDALTRPLLCGIFPSPQSHITRGGNTVFINPQTLNALPNGLAIGAFSNARRQDEVWRIAGEAVCGWQIGCGGFAVTQMRDAELPCAPDIARLRADVVGHAVSHALREVGRELKSITKSGGIDEWCAQLIQREHELGHKLQSAARIRLTCIEQSFFRIVGIAESMQTLLQAMPKNVSTQNALHAVVAIQKLFAPAQFAKLRTQVDAELHNINICSALTDFAKLCARIPADSNVQLWRDWLGEQRIQIARCRIKKIITPKAKIRELGNGGEGSVFTDGKRVYKFLHRWDARPLADFERLVENMRGEWNADAIYPLLDVRRESGDLILATPFEKTAPYRGGCGAGIAAMLAGMKKRGMVFWNIAPKNLRQAKHAVRFVDYGCDVHPFTEKDFDLAVRKAWLCWKFGARKNLPALLTASLTDRNLPELAGYEKMKIAAKQFARHPRVADTAVAEVLRDSPKKILDYGFGKGADACTLVANGVCVSAYDPMRSRKVARKLKAAGVKLLTAAQLSKKKRDGEKLFDAILLRHVICEIRADAELRACLANVRRLIAPHGKVVVTACDMGDMGMGGKVVKQKLTAVNHAPPSANAARKFFYRKYIRSTGSSRDHVHRPEKMLIAEFKRAGFVIADRRTFADMDLDTFESCGGVLQWTLTPSGDGQ